jgi:hypothetical protein
LIHLPDKLEMAAVASLRSHDRNARTHSKAQIEQIRRSIERFGFTNPVLVDGGGAIIAGHGRVAAAKLLKLESVPVLRLEGIVRPTRQSAAGAISRADKPRVPSLAPEPDSPIQPVARSDYHRQPAFLRRCHEEPGQRAEARGGPLSGPSGLRGDLVPCE